MSQEELYKSYILSEAYRDFIVDSCENQLFPTIPKSECCEQSMEYLYRTIYVPEAIADSMELQQYPYDSIPKCFTLLDTDALHQAGISQVQNYRTLELYGQNVMIGFVDTGIDYTNSAFCNIDGSTRIAGIWDQTIQSGTPPEHFLYGTEYTEEMLNMALQTQKPLELVPTRDVNGHGTFLASIAAGSGNPQEQFVGAAPEATIAVVKLKQAKHYLREYYFIRDSVDCFQENDIMLGIRYLSELAKKRRMPLVICIALGTNMGGHHSALPIDCLLDRYATLSDYAVIIGAGNEANERHHFLGKVKEKEDVRAELRVGENVSGFTMELWTEIPNIMNFSIVTPSGEKIFGVPVRQNETECYRFVLEGTTISVTDKLFVEQSSAELIYVRVNQPMEGIWTVVVRAEEWGDGVFHMWLPTKEALNGTVYFLESDPDTTITEPGCTNHAITVGYYDGNNGSIGIGSGRGYTRNDIVKPDLIAPGVNVTGACLHHRFTEKSGASIAAGISAGASALLLEWLVYKCDQKRVDTVKLRNFFLLGANRRAEEMYPNREWGYGTLDLYKVFDVIRRI